MARITCLQYWIVELLLPICLFWPNKENKRSREQEKSAITATALGRAMTQCHIRFEKEMSQCNYPKRRLTLALETEQGISQGCNSTFSANASAESGQHGLTFVVAVNFRDFKQCVLLLYWMYVACLLLFYGETARLFVLMYGFNLVMVICQLQLPLGWWDFRLNFRRAFFTFAPLGITSISILMLFAWTANRTSLGTLTFWLSLIFPSHQSSYLLIGVVSFNWKNFFYYSEMMKAQGINGSTLLNVVVLWAHSISWDSSVLRTKYFFPSHGMKILINHKSSTSAYIITCF